jgi:hypothetical protein
VVGVSASRTPKLSAAHSFLSEGADLSTLSSHSDPVA